jgi:hypothetical protein
MLNHGESIVNIFLSGHTPSGYVPELLRNLFNLMQSQESTFCEEMIIQVDGWNFMEILGQFSRRHCKKCSKVVRGVNLGLSIASWMFLKDDSRYMAWYWI